MNTAERIFKIADAKYQEQREFAAALNIAPSVVSAWRVGKSASYQKRLAEIAQLLGTTVDYLVNGEPAGTTEVSESDRQILQMIHDKPGLRTMFSISAKATEEDILKAVEILKAFYGDAER